MRKYNDETSRGRVALRLLLATGILSTPLAAQDATIELMDAQDATFELMDAIPDDMFIVTANRPNPERQFLDDYWGEVCQAFEDSGTVAEVLDLVISFSDEDQRAEIRRIQDKFTKLIDAVEWSRLASKEIAFGERLHRPGSSLDASTHRSIAEVFIGPPDIVLLFQSEPDIARDGFEGIVAIARAAFSEIDKLAGTTLEFEELDLDGTPFVTMNLLQAVPRAPQMPVSIGLHDDVLILTFGTEIRADVAGLLAGTGSKRAISESPKFKAAFAALPAADDAIEFFDMNNLKSTLDTYADTVFRALKQNIHSSTPKDDILNSRQDSEANTLSKFAIEAYFRGDNEKALKLTEAAHEANPHDSLVLYNLACFNSLVGHQDNAIDWLEQAVEGGFHAPYKIAHDSDLSALHDNPRFQAAVDSARISASSVSNGWLSASETLVNRCMESLGIVDYSATVHLTDGYSTYTESITVLAEDARDNPFYPVLTASRPIDSFAKWLPKETITYAVSGGADLQPLYIFLEEAMEETGPWGEQLLTDWAELQQEWGINVQKDLLGMCGGELVQASFLVNGRPEWIWMAAVKDDQVATDMLNSALKALPLLVRELSKQNPMMTMMALRSWPTNNEELAGFNEVMIGMSQQKTMCGVHDGWLVFGSSPEAVLLTRATAAGEHPNVLENEALMSAALVPDGPVTIMTFADHGNDAAAAAAAIYSMTMGGSMITAMIPEPEARQAVMRIFSIIAGLAPIVEAVDFYDSSSSISSFDGKTWRTRAVTHYVSPEDR